ncbi:MAG: acylphosphatase [Methylococcus sp.]|jgi:acylphosphatase|nr:MAG: acylphosphatase [Methylococcus sp.]
MKKAIHVLVEGRVQGVFYRVSAREKALALGVEGWVRHRQEGQVEIMALGPEAALSDFLAWCREGPQGTLVIGLTLHEVPQEGLGPGFKILD